MAWNINFCAPFLPNDDTINFNRYLQSIQLLLLMIVYFILHIYYQMFGHRKEQQNQAQSSQEASSENNSDQNTSSNFHSKSDSDSNNESSVADDESRNQRIFSIGLGKDIQEGQSHDPFKQSTIGLKQNAKTKSIEDQLQIVQNDTMTVSEVQKYFPIVYGHHAIIVGASIMYSPYMEQTIMAFLYFMLSLILIGVNIKRYRKTTFGIWIVMCIVNVCIMMSGLLQVGQSNYDFIKLKCFSEQYVSLY